jgi:hypothetical protein
VFVLSYVYVAALRRADHSSKESYRLCKKGYEIEKERRGSKKELKSHWLMDGWMDGWMDEWMNELSFYSTYSFEVGAVFKIQIL